MGSALTPLCCPPSQIFRSFIQTKVGTNSSPTQKYEPNLRGVGAVPKTRVGSAPLPRLSNQTHGYIRENIKELHVNPTKWHKLYIQKDMIKPKAFYQSFIRATTKQLAC
jgi:hypothetical protein